MRLRCVADIHAGLPVDTFRFFQGLGLSQEAWAGADVGNRSSRSDAADSLSSLLTQLLASESKASIRVKATMGDGEAISGTKTFVSMSFAFSTSRDSVGGFHSFGDDERVWAIVADAVSTDAWLASLLIQLSRIPHCSAEEPSRLNLWQNSVLAAGMVPRARAHELLGVAPLQWFGRAWVDAFGGDEVFEDLPEGWARRCESGLWKVSGLDDPEDVQSYDELCWSERERAIIEHLGPEWFFDVASGQLAERMLTLPPRPPVPMYFRDEGRVVSIAKPDGMCEVVELDAPSVDVLDEKWKQVVQRAQLFIEEMDDAGVVDLVSLDAADSAEWVDTWARGQSMYDADTAAMLVGSWLGEFALRHARGVRWVVVAQSLNLRAGASDFDPFKVAALVIADDPDCTVPGFVADIREQLI